MPQFGFPGLRPGDRWCLCAPRWREALKAGYAPRVVLRGTHEGTARRYQAIRPRSRLTFAIAPGLRINASRPGLSFERAVWQGRSTPGNIIADGKPPVALSPTSCMRFKEKSWSEAQLQQDVALQPVDFYRTVAGQRAKSRKRRIPNSKILRLGTRRPSNRRAPQRMGTASVETRPNDASLRACERSTAPPPTTGDRRSPVR
jgi:hypothetical protein